MFRKLVLSLAAVVGNSAASAESLYVLIPPVSTQKIACWAPHFSKYDTIVGYSVLGHFFLRSSTDDEYIVLHPFKKSAKSYGVFRDAKEFERGVLMDEGFSEYVLRPAHVKEVRKAVGPIKEGEIYIPKPYPFLGGSDKPETYSKGNVWVFMDIVGQMQGLCG